MHFHDTKASKLVALITALSLIAHAKVLAMSTSLLGNGGDIMALLLGLGGLFYPIFGVLSVIGLWRHRPWGFYAFYAHLVLGTLLFGRFLHSLPTGRPAARDEDLGGHRDQSLGFVRRRGGAPANRKKQALRARGR